MHDTIKQFFEQNKDKKYKWPELPAGNIYDQANWVLHQSNAPWFEVQGLDVPYKTMLEEAKNLKELFVSHRDEESKHDGWRALAIHGISATKTNIPENYGLDPNEVKYTWTEIQDRCPETVRFFRESFPYDDYMRVRFMLLEPGGYIMPHSDNTKSMLCAAVNISLNHPEGCHMITEQGIMPFRDEGSVFYFNNHYKHAVINTSDTDRFHIIVHGRYNLGKLARYIVDSYPKQS